MTLMYFTVALAVALGAPRAFAASEDVSNNFPFPSDHVHREIRSLGYEYGKCKGSCRHDRDCHGSLLCLKDFDKRYNNFFPGCSRFPPRDENWCYDPKDFSNKLFFIGNEGKPKGVFPLEKCRGDCDTDNDCKGSLRCYERYDEKSVPGCRGITAEDGVDYCYNPDDDKPNRRRGGGPNVYGTLKIIGNPPKGLLQNCQGDCDEHVNCAGKLLCYQRDANDNDDKIPGCKGTAKGDTDYCYDPKYKKKVPGGGSKKNYPTLKRIYFDKCEGDCDDDNDCKGNFRCYQNHEYGEHRIPGCSGLVKDSTDYCYDPRDE